MEKHRRLIGISILIAIACTVGTMILFGPSTSEAKLPVSTLGATPLLVAILASFAYGSTGTSIFLLVTDKPPSILIRKGIMAIGFVLILELVPLALGYAYHWSFHACWRISQFAVIYSWGVWHLLDLRRMVPQHSQLIEEASRDADSPNQA